MMNKYEHLPLIPYQDAVERQTRGGGGYELPAGREKAGYAQEAKRKADSVVSTLDSLKSKYAGILKPSLIFELEINQNVDFNTIEKILTSMGIHVLSSAENKKGYWVVFSDDENLQEFKRKLEEYGSPTGHKYDFFNAFEALSDIPKEEKIGKRLEQNPLGEKPEFIDIELWRMADEDKNRIFIEELERAYPDRRTFRITDTLFTKSFVLLRVQLNGPVFDEVIELKEIARADRPALPIFNPFDLSNIDTAEIETHAPEEDATGILIIDSGIVSNHPLLEKCIGGEENFQTGEEEMQDKVGHGTAVAGCSAYGDIEKCLDEKSFIPSNWIFSAKVLYAEENAFNGGITARYDPEKLVEHQFKDAVESFLSHSDYHIRVVNISLGNSNEIWHKTYNRQLPLAALIDELAFTFPNVVFIVSTGNNHPLDEYESIDEIVAEYPLFLKDNENWNLLNPATSALSLTIGSIAQAVRAQAERYGEEHIKTAIAEGNQPSPFTRTGPGINGMVKPELVEYGGNVVLYNNYGRITEDKGGKLLLLNNQVMDKLTQFDAGTSYSAPKVARMAGEIANRFPQKNANFIKNLLLSSASNGFNPRDVFYHSGRNRAAHDHLDITGFGLPIVEKAINSYDNRVILFAEDNIQLDTVKVYTLELPEIFFSERGYKLVTVTLAFTPETRSTRGDSYLGNRMDFHLFHSVNPQELVNKFGNIRTENEGEEVASQLEAFEIKLFPGVKKIKSGCHQKAWKEFKREPRNRPASPVSLVLINYNKWISEKERKTDYCLSVTFEHSKEIDLYNQVRTNIQQRARVR